MTRNQAVKATARGMPPITHISVRDLACAWEGPTEPPSVIEWQWVVHLSLGCDWCWEEMKFSAKRSILGSWSSRLRSALDKVFLSSVADRNRLAPRHRAALRAAQGGGPELCMLLLEEEAAANVGRPVPESGEYFWFPPAILTLAVADEPDLAHDLIARYMVLTAENLCLRKKWVAANRAVTLARDYAAAGRGGPEPRASVLEAAALVAAGRTNAERCLALVDESLDALARYRPRDRRAEVLLNVGVALTKHGESMGEHAAALLRRAAAEIDRVDPAVNPELRARIRHLLEPAAGSSEAEVPVKTPPEPRARKPLKTTSAGRYRLYEPLPKKFHRQKKQR